MPADENTKVVTPEPDPIDGLVFIEVASSGLAAFITITEAKYGGHAITLEDVDREIEKEGITTGIDIKPIVSIIETFQFGKKICFARGIDSTPGIDGSIKFYYRPSSEFVAKEDKFGAVDYRNLGLVRNIYAGTKIALIEPPQDGKEGVDVYGAPIPFEPGKEVRYPVGDGTALSEDGLELHSTVDGNLKWTGDRFVVEETLVIKGDVDAGVGNIDFIGNVNIKGEVRENFTIISKKNITVGTTITGATLIADGDILINFGSINSDITAGGSVKLNFCENTKISCGCDLTVQSCVISDIFCEGVVNATSGKGVIVGGKCVALQGISANIIGSDSFAKTHITLGNNAVLAEEKLQLEDKIAANEANIKKLLQITELLQEHKRKYGPLPPERESMLATSIRSRFTFQRECKQHAARVKEIDILLQQKQDLRIYAKKEIWPGATVRIGEQCMVIKERNVRAMIQVNDEDELEITNIPT